MSFGIGDALLAALAGGAQKYGQDYEAEKEQKEADERARIAAVAKESYDKRMAAYNVSLQPPKYQTYDDTQDGKAGKRTVKQVFDQGTGTWQDTDLGFAPNKATPPTTRNVIMGQNEATQQFNPDTGQWDTIGSPGPRFKPDQPAVGGSKFGFEEYMNAAPSLRALYDRFRRGGDDPTDKADQQARVATIKDLRDQASFTGKPPTDVERANALYDNQTMMGADPFKSVKAGTSTTAAPTLPAGAQQSPAQPGAPTVQDLISQADAAVKRGANQQQVKARLQQLMKQYGYQPQ